MIERRQSDGAKESRAIYSDCETYRYGLERRWGNGPCVLFIMLNPSTADERRNDPTIERCERRAHTMQFGAMAITNLFAFRATRPADLKRASDPVGPDNDALLCDWQHRADMTLAAWGVHGLHRDRACIVRGFLTGPLHHLGLTKHGHPKHPLYVPYAQSPLIWSEDNV